MEVNSGDAKLDSLIQSWMEWSLDGSADQQAMASLVEDKDFKTLRKLMLSRKTFGTAGIRGKMGPG